MRRELGRERGLPARSQCCKLPHWPCCKPRRASFGSNCFWKEWTEWNPAKGKNALVHWLLSIALRTSPCIEFHTSALVRCCKPEKKDIFRIGSWGNDLESRSRWVRTHLLVDSRTLLLVDSGALLLIDCRTLFLVDRWALLLIHCVAHLEVWDAVFSISPWETSNSVSYLLVHCVLDSATLLLLNGWTLLFIHSRALLLIDGWALLFIDSWTLLLIDSVVFCLALLLVHSVALLLLHCVANLEISVQDPVRKNKTESGAELTCSLTVEHCCSLTVEHCCSWTVLHTWMRHFLIESKLERNENQNPVQTYLFINGGTLLFIYSWTLLLLNSGALVLLHGSALLLIHCVALLKHF